MRSVLASPEFDTDMQVNEWTRMHKASEPMYGLLRMIAEQCLEQGIRIETESKDLVALAKQLVEEVDGKLLQVNRGNDANRTEVGN